MSNGIARNKKSAVRLPALSWVTYWRQTFSKLLLLALRFFLLVCIARLLFRAGGWTGTP